MTELTEEMIDAPRPFLLGLECGCSTLERMREHFDLSGHSIDSWPDWAKVEKGHITKAGKAIIIWHMMEAAKPT